MVPHPVGLDRHRPPPRPGLSGVVLGEPLDPEAITLGVDAPDSLAVRFIDSPLKWGSTAVTFSAGGLPAGGLPRGGVAVTFSPQALQR